MTILDDPRHHADAPLRGELDRIPDQVGENLSQAGGVTQNLLRHLARRLVVESDPLLASLDPQHLDDLEGHLVELSLGRFQLQMTCFDLRQVEDVVDQSQQVRAVGVNRVEVTILLFDRSRHPASQHIREPQHGIHRRANLVAHVGQKVALGPVGRLGGFFRDMEFLLLLFQQCHIVEAGQYPTIGAAMSEDW